MAPAAQRARPSTWKAALAGLLLFLGFDVLVLRSGAYDWVVKPNSSAGWTVLRTRFDEVMLPRAERTVALLGDSRVGEALVPELLNERWPDRAVWARSEAMPGSSPRVWSFLLEQLDPHGGRWPVLVVPLLEYDDYDLHIDMADRTGDLPFLVPLCSVLDTFDLAASFDEPAARQEALLTSLCKIYGFRRDLQDLAAAPLQRYRDVRWRMGAYYWAAPYAGHSENLAGLHLEGGRIVGLPPDADPALAAALHGLTVPPPPDTGRERAYRRRWLGRICAHEAATGTQVVFLRMPTRVLPRRDPRPPWQPTLDELTKSPNVHALERDLFAELERPQFFFDALHMNRRGAVRFTELLGDELLRRFGARLGR
jgi:hypothetical protein